MDSLKDLEDLIKNFNFNFKGVSNNLVFGSGNPKSDLLIIGEAPGEEEDKKLEPFVGMSGKIVDKILEFLKLKREEVYITNVFDFRPENNRKPTEEEIEKYLPFTLKKISIIKPKKILILGSVASQSILKSKEKISDLRKIIHFYENIPVICTYHPSFLLRKRYSIEYIKKDLELLLNI